MRSNRSPLGDMSSTYAINLDKLSSESQCVSFPNQMETTGFQSSNLPASAYAAGPKRLEKDSLGTCWCFPDSTFTDLAWMGLWKGLHEAISVSEHLVLFSLARNGLAKAFLKEECVIRIRTVISESKNASETGKWLSHVKVMQLTWSLNAQNPLM